MAYGGLNKMDATAESGRNPVSKRQIQPDIAMSVETRQNLSRETNAQGRTGTGKYSFSLFS